jgi:putative ABC transport system substrate-binding protein
VKLAQRAVTVLALALLVAFSAAEAQEPGKVQRIGYLSLASDTGSPRDYFVAFRDGLRALGYVDGENIVIEPRHADGRPERLPELAGELIRLKVDVLVTFGSASAAKQATNTVPIVFIVEPDPVGTGLVASLAHPGGNITGISDAHADLVPKRLELLKQVVPRAARVGFLLNPANHNTASQLKTARAAGPALRLTVVPVEVKGPEREDLDRAFATMGRERLAALLVLGDPMLGINRTRIAELAIKHRLPTAGTGRAWAEGGLLMAYGANFTELFRRAATYVDKILKGAKPADLPVEQPTTFNLAINLKTARALGVTLPPSLLRRADHVIQ